MENPKMTDGFWACSAGGATARLGWLGATAASTAVLHGAAGAPPQTAAASSRKEKDVRRTPQAPTEVRLQEKMPLWLAETRVPAVGVAIIENGKLKVARIFGELRNGVPAPVDTLFEVASLTKP